MIDKRIIPLTVGALGIGTSEFTIMGLLPDMAKSLQVSIPQTGMLISAYALGVVIGAPTIIAFSLKQAPKKILLILMALYALFNGLSIVANSYQFMLVTRFLSGLPHGAFFGVGAVVAARFAAKGKAAIYISLMFAGLTFANLVAVPLVTYIGHTYHWRWYFGIVAAISLLTLVLLYFMMPDMAPNKEANIREEIRIVKNAEVWYLLLITGIGFGGLFAWLSYITPLMTHVSGIAPDNMAYVMALAGGGMVAGNFAGGYLSDRIGAIKATTLLFGAMLVALVLVFCCAGNTPVALVLTFLCGGLSMSVASPLNILVMKAAPKSEMFATAFIQGAFNFANTSGAYLGGLPLTWGYAYTYPSLVGALMTLVGVLLCLVYSRKYTGGVAVPEAARV
jgi:DHA1 family arabinose polymer transporter-like MFS transporter